MFNTGLCLSKIEKVGLLWGFLRALFYFVPVCVLRVYVALTWRVLGLFFSPPLGCTSCVVFCRSVCSRTHSARLQEMGFSLSFRGTR